MYSREAERDSAYGLFSGGMGLLRAGHPHQAALLLSRAKRAEPAKASIREGLGRALFMIGRVTGARREFARVVQLDPANDYAHFGLALACERTGQRDRARAHVKLALAMRPGTCDYLRVLERLAG
jgi:Flp pilus assembly protein TadD